MKKLGVVGWGLLTGIASCSGHGKPIGGDDPYPPPFGTGGFVSSFTDPGPVPECLRPRPENRGSIGGAGSIILMSRCSNCGWAADSERCREVVFAVPTSAFPDDYVRCARESDEFSGCLRGYYSGTCDVRIPAGCESQCEALAACW